jgi:hypothetical protein
MVQIFQEAPDPGTQHAQAIGQLFGGGLSQGIGVALNQMLEEKKQQKKLNSIMSLLGQPSASGIGTASQEIDSLNKPAKLNLTPESVAAISMVDPQLGNVFAKLHETQSKSFEKQRAFESQRSTKYLDKVSDLATNLPERKIAIQTAKAAVQSGEMKPFGGDFVADILNLPQLRTASGAQLATAAKTNLIGSLSQITGGRPNQFIEQQISNAFAKAGQTEQANLAQLNIIEAKLDIDEKLAEATDQLSDEYRQQLGYVPESIDRDVRKLVKPFAEQRMKELAYDLREINEKEIGAKKLSELKKVPNGTPLTLRQAKILVDKYGDKAEEVAIKLGYEIPESEIYQRAGR